MLMKEGELNSSFLFTDQTVLMLMLELDLFSEDKHKYLVLNFRLRCGQHYADRDIVQFVPFREFKAVSLIFFCVKNVK